MSFLLPETRTFSWTLVMLLTICLLALMFVDPTVHASHQESEVSYCPIIRHGTNNYNETFRRGSLNFLLPEIFDINNVIGKNCHIPEEFENKTVIVEMECIKSAVRYHKGNIIIIHSRSGESGTDTAFYDAPQVIRVYRKYMHPWVAKGSQGKIRYVPLAPFKTFFEGVPKNYKPKRASKRKFSWAFFGDTVGKGTRGFLLSEYWKIPGGKSRDAPGPWFRTSGNKSLTPKEVRKVMQNAKFCPVWQGYRAPDSFRWLEALESGCIPIPEKGVRDYYVDWYNISGYHLLEDLPFTDGPYTVLPVMWDLMNQTDVELDRLFFKVQKWYKGWKAHFRNESKSFMKQNCE